MGSMSAIQQEKDRLKEILSRQDYKAYDEQPERAGSRIGELLSQWVRDLLETFFPGAEITGSTVDGVLYFFGAIGLGILVFLAFRLFSKLSGEKQAHRNRPLLPGEEGPLSLESHWKQADDRAAQQQWTAAARQVFLGLLLHLDDQGFVDVQSWKTNGDYEKELRAHTGADDVEAFRRLALMYDQMTYGERLLNESGYYSFRSDASRYVERGREGEAG